MTQNDSIFYHDTNRTLAQRKIERFLGYIVMLRARMFRSLIPVLMIKERNIRARNVTILPLFATLESVRTLSHFHSQNAQIDDKFVIQVFNRLVSS